MNLRNLRKSKKKRILAVRKPLKTPRLCRHSLYPDYETGETVCLKCHQVLDHIYEYVNENTKVKNSDMLIWNRDYDKQRWILDTLEYLNGEHNDALNDLCWMELLEEVPNPCSWYEVYQVFHKYRLTDYWICFASYVGLKVAIPRQVLTLVLLHSDLGYTKYRISFMYLFYKFMQIVDEPQSMLIPLKGTKPWLKKTDLWWQTICEQKDWVFKPSKTCKLTWNKDEIVRSLKVIVDGL